MQFSMVLYFLLFFSHYYLAHWDLVFVLKSSNFQLFGLECIWTYELSCNGKYDFRSYSQEQHSSCILESKQSSENWNKRNRENMFLS